MKQFEPNTLQIELMTEINSGVKEKRLDSFLLDKEEIEALRELAKNNFVEQGSPEWNSKDKTIAWC